MEGRRGKDIIVPLFAFHFLWAHYSGTLYNTKTIFTHTLRPSFLEYSTTIRAKTVLTQPNSTKPSQISEFFIFSPFLKFFHKYASGGRISESGPVARRHRCCAELTRLGVSVPGAEVLGSVDDMAGSSAPVTMAPSSTPRSMAPSSAPEWLAPSSLLGHPPCPGARRQHQWRRAKGPFSEFFLPGVYLWETFKKGLNYKKFDTPGARDGNRLVLGWISSGSGLAGSGSKGISHPRFSGSISGLVFHPWIPNGYQNKSFGIKTHVL